MDGLHIDLPAEQTSLLTSESDSEEHTPNSRERAVFVAIHNASKTNRLGAIAHRSRLRGASSFFNAVLSPHWQQADDPVNCAIISVSVPDGCDRVTNALILYMSQGTIQPEIVHDAESLLKFTEMAKYFGADQVVNDCLYWLLHHHLKSSPDWSTCLYCVGDWVDDQLSQSPEYPPCKCMAEECMQAMLGNDLELITQNEAKCSMLTSLPYYMLLQLMSSHETKAHSESTVVYAITLWLSAQIGSVSMEQLKQLVQCVRLRSLPDSYRQQVLPQLHWWQQTVSQDGAPLVEVWLKAARDAEAAYEQMQPESYSPIHAGHANPHDEKREHIVRHNLQRRMDEFGLSPQDKAVWLLAMRGPRSASAVQELMLSVTLTEAQLLEAFVAAQAMQAQDSTDGTWQTTCYMAFAGVHWQLVWRYKSCQQQKGWMLQVGIVYEVVGMPGSSTIVLWVPTPQLQHAAAQSPASSRLTRQRLRQYGGDPDQELIPLQQHRVLACKEELMVVPYGQEQLITKHLAALMDASGKLQLQVHGIRGFD